MGILAGFGGACAKMIDLAVIVLFGNVDHVLVAEKIPKKSNDLNF